MDSRKFYGFWSFAIVLSVVLVLFSLIFASCSDGAKSPTPSVTPSATVTTTGGKIKNDDTTSTAAPTETSPAETSPVETAPPSTILAQTDDMGQEYLDSIIFMGDSTTYGMKAYGVLSGGRETTQVWTPENGTFTLFNQSRILIFYPDTGENLTIEDVVSRKKPEYMVITLGVNGVASLDEDAFKSDYKALINRILAESPDTKIMLNSIYPVTRGYNTSTGINNDKISRANGWVLDIAEELGLRYLNTASVLMDEDGFLPESYHNGDGMHPTGDAFQLIVNYIRTHGYR